MHRYVLRRSLRITVKHILITYSKTYPYDRVHDNGSDFWPKSQILKENFLNK